MPKLNTFEVAYYEIIRRLPEAKRLVIEDKLKEVTAEHIVLLGNTIADQINLLKQTSFIHDALFPYIALHAVRTGYISPIQFGTLMALWGNLENIIPLSSQQTDQKVPEFVPLFTETGEKNLRATELLRPTLRSSNTLPNLFEKNSEEIFQGIYDKAIDLPQSEQGFWLVEDRIRNNVGAGRTITQEIKSLNVKFLALNEDDKREIIPSFGLQQIFLEVAFPHAVRINPVIGDSTPTDIRKGSLERYRDIALPFPGNELPKMADNFSAPSPLDFLFHDRYHAIRASRVTPEETAHYIAISDELNVIQKRFDSAVKEFNKRHTKHISLLPEFGKLIEEFPAEKKREVIAELLKKFNHERAIIGKLKKVRKSFGQLKFRIWDMERAYSGGIIDEFKSTAIQELTRIIGSIEVDLNVLKFDKYVGRRAAHTVMQTVKPEVATLTAVQNQIRTARILPLFLTSQQPGTLAFDDAILAGPELAEPEQHSERCTLM